MHGGALDSRDLAVGRLDQLRVELVGLAELEVHAQQHFGEILRIVPAGPGRYFEKRVGAVPRAAEHAPELQPLHLRGEGLHALPHVREGRLVLLGKRQFQQLVQVAGFGGEAIEHFNDRLER